MPKAAIIPTKIIPTIFKLLEDESFQSRQGYPLKYKAIFGIGIYTALRIGEIITLKYDDVYNQNASVSKSVVDTLVVKRLKKRATLYSEIPVNKSLKSILLDYKKQYDADDSVSGLYLKKINPYLFPSTTASMHLDYTTVNERFVEVFKKVNLKGASTHSMRRTALTALKDTGVDFETIRQISGHEHIDELREYLVTTPETLKQAIDKLKY